jgi:Tfp pilus assembly protein FimT
MKHVKVNTSKGFTLIELFIVAAVLIILGGIAAMNFANYATKRDAENDIKQLYADLMKARAMAITQSRTIQVRFSNTSSKAYTLVTDLNEDGDFDDPGEILERATLKLDLYWNNNPASGVNIAFSSKGIVTSNGTFTNNVSDAEYNCINVFATRINLGRLSGGQCEAK